MSARTLLVPGTQVVKGPLALPATATSTLYTVSGGSVLVTGIFGRVTTACGATVTTVSLGTGATTNTSLATATAVTSAASGTFLTQVLSAGAFGALSVGLGPKPLITTFPPAGEVQLPGVLAAFFIANDTITWTTSATDTGAVQWYLWYLPIDTSATVS